MPDILDILCKRLTRIIRNIATAPPEKLPVYVGQYNEIRMILFDMKIQPHELVEGLLQSGFLAELVHQKIGAANGRTSDTD